MGGLPESPTSLTCRIEHRSGTSHPGTSRAISSPGQSPNLSPEPYQGKQALLQSVSELHSATRLSPPTDLENYTFGLKLDSVTAAQVQEKGRDIAVVALHIEQKGGHVGIIPSLRRRSGSNSARGTSLLGRQPSAALLDALMTPRLSQSINSHLVPPLLIPLFAQTLDAVVKKRSSLDPPPTVLTTSVPPLQCQHRLAQNSLTSRQPDNRTNGQFDSSTTTCAL